jgi:hypothetical protein
MLSDFAPALSELRDDRRRSSRLPSAVASRARVAQAAVATAAPALLLRRTTEREGQRRGSRGAFWPTSGCRREFLGHERRACGGAHEEEGFWRLIPVARARQLSVSLVTIGVDMGQTGKLPISH